MRLKKIINTNESIIPFLLRLILGGVILPHGYQKITGFTTTMGHLTHDYGLPWLIAFFVVMTEFFASILLLAGAVSRIVAFLIGLVMLGAIPYHWSNGFFMNWFGNQAGEGFEYHILAIGVAIVLVISGGGKWSTDALITKKHEA